MHLNFFLRLFRGEIALWITFWIFGVVIPCVVDVIFEDINTTKLLSVNVVSIAFYTHSIFMLIAIWRSAKNYKGPAIWRISTYLVMIAITILFIGSFFLLHTVDWVGKMSKTNLESVIDDTNSSLPKVFSGDIELTQVSLDQNTLKYDFKLINHQSSEVVLNKFKEQITPFSTYVTCSHKVTKMYLAVESIDLDNDEVHLVASYKDKHNANITDINVVISECLPYLSAGQ